MDDECIRKMATLEGILSWYRDERPRAFPDVKRSSHYPKWYRFSAEEQEIIGAQFAKKQRVREAIKSHSNNGPFGVALTMDWLSKCGIYRMLAKEHPTGRADYIERHRRTIKILRQQRFCFSIRRAGVSRRSFYVEPNTNFVPVEDIPKAKAEGLSFVKVSEIMSRRLYSAIRNQLEKSGRMSSFWSAENEDDVATFLFNDPKEAEKVIEEIIWCKLRHNM
jgi:hypothetical protein